MGLFIFRLAIIYTPFFSFTVSCGFDAVIAFSTDEYWHPAGHTYSVVAQQLTLKKKKKKMKPAFLGLLAIAIT
ncbi:hypothetical protein QQ054_36270 [Oscillatoria amoena NRMC-F 0135]|nr:hypothetical protein [Oscillatoria amoena NRMC-F 0135]